MWFCEPYGKVNPTSTHQQAHTMIISAVQRHRTGYRMTVPAAVIHALGLRHTSRVLFVQLAEGRYEMQSLDHIIAAQQKATKL